MYKDSNPKVDIYVGGIYQGSTNWSRTCKEAKEKYVTNNPNVNPDTVKCVKGK